MMVVGLFYERVGRGATYHFRPQTKKTHFMDPGLVIWRHKKYFFNLIEKREVTDSINFYGDLAFASFGQPI